MKVKIPLSYTPIDVAGLQHILRQYEDLPHTRIVEDFEQKLRVFAGTKFAVALNSGTSAIHLALKAAGVGNGDEVLVSSFTYVGTINPILYLGARPVFIDSEEISWNMDPALLEEAIQQRMNAGIKPKAILIVHTYGMPAAMDRILEIGRKFSIQVIEDAAESLGSQFASSKAGSLGVMGVYSFNNNKLVTCYGGGAIVTNDTALYEKIAFWSTQAREPKPFYEHKEVGFNYKMPALSAAQGLFGMGSIGEKIQARRKVFDGYSKIFAKLDGVRSQIEAPGSYSNRWLSAFCLPEKRLEPLRNSLESEGIETRPLWNPMHQQPVFQSFISINRGKASELFKAGITLPSSDWLTQEKQQKIISIVLSSFGYA